MIIEGNQKELDAMKEFHKGNRQEGLRLQEEFAAAFREEYKDKDHCPCQKACRYHGNCKECVAIILLLMRSSLRKRFFGKNFNKKDGETRL